MGYKPHLEYRDSRNKQTLCKTENAKGTGCIRQLFHICIIITLIILLTGLVGGMIAKTIYVSIYLDELPKFSLTVGSINGLLPSNRFSTTISPVFNLTLHVDSSNTGYSIYCINKGETKVFYQQVQIVAAPTAWFCREPSIEYIMIHAWNMELTLPPLLRNQLFEEVKKGKAVFEVKLVLDLTNPHSLGRLFIDCPLVNASATMFSCKHYANWQLIDADRVITRRKGRG